MPIRDRLAEVALSMRAEALPDDVIRETKRLILDTLGCAIGAVHGAPCEQIRTLARMLGGRPESTVIGQPDRTSCTLAALVNGTLLRFLDANDYYFGRDPAHASGNFAAALAVAEHAGLTGRDVILGLVVGYEIQLRFCDHAGQPNLWDRGWHHATNMQFAAAALSARLLGLDRDGIANAIAIAGTHNNTLTESMRGDMATIKATIEATTAKAGIEAALMAQHGLTGPKTIFEGTFGWTNVVAGELDADSLTQPIAGHYRIMDACMKPFAAHALSQGHIQAAIDLMRQHPVDVMHIERVEALYPSQVLRQPSMDKAKLDPHNKETADHSPPYLVAMGLLYGACGPDQFTADNLVSPRVRHLLERTELKADARLDPLWPRSMAGAVHVVMDDGRSFEALCTHPPGDPKNRLTDSDLEKKFRAYTKNVLDSRQSEQIIAAVNALDDCDDLEDFTALLRVDWRA